MGSANVAGVGGLGLAVMATPNTLSIFYGYPADLIAGWCGVSVATARLWKSGVRKPSRQALRLFSTYRDHRVLNDDWRGWKIVHGDIVDPSGNATTAAQLQGYRMILQWVSEVAARDPDTKRQYYELLRRA